MEVGRDHVVAQRGAQLGGEHRIAPRSPPTMNPPQAASRAGGGGERVVARPGGHRLARGSWSVARASWSAFRTAVDEAFAGRGSVMMLVGAGHREDAHGTGAEDVRPGARRADALGPRPRIDRCARLRAMGAGRTRVGRANDVRAPAEVLQGAGGELVRLFPELPSLPGQLPPVTDESRSSDRSTRTPRSCAPPPSATRW